MRVVAAVDSFEASSVVRTAVAVARATNAEIIALHACEETRESGRGAPTSAAAAAALAGVPLRVSQGGPADVILQEIAHDEVVAGVLGTHTWPVGQRVGDVARTVIEAASKPLFVVPPAAAPSARFRRVLVPSSPTAPPDEVTSATRALVGPQADLIPHEFAPRATEPAPAADLVVLTEDQLGAELSTRVLEASGVPVLLLPSTTSPSIGRSARAGATRSVDRWGHPIDVLLVEDDPGHARLTRCALDGVPMVNSLRIVPSGEAALAALHRQPPYEDAELPELVLLDLNLPGMDGRDVLRHIKSDAVLRRIPVAVLTSSSAEMDVDLIYELGATCLITKPLRFAEFVASIQALGQFWFTAVTPPRIEETV